MRHVVRLAATSVAFFAVTAMAIPAQELAIPPPGSPRLTFDVIAIHPVKQWSPSSQCFTRVSLGGDGYQVRCGTVRNMMALMYRIPERQITNAPVWLSEERFDIDAKAEKGHTLDELRTMFKSMFADRFGLTFHTERKEGNIYALKVDRSGLKMKPNTSPEDFKVPFTGAYDSFTGTRVPMERLCWQFELILKNDERPVVNLTGLTGNYDFKLDYLPELPSGVDKDRLPPRYLDRPSLFTAVREQLGLKLTAQKGPVTYIVIDHVDKPSEN